MIIIENCIKYVIMGILSAYILFYGLRPSIPNPDIILEPLEHNWIFIILFVLNYYLFVWDIKLGVLMLICNVSLIFDIYVFTQTK